MYHDIVISQYYLTNDTINISIVRYIDLFSRETSLICSSRVTRRFDKLLRYFFEYSKSLGTLRYKFIENGLRFAVNYFSASFIHCRTQKKLKTHSPFLPF